MKIADIDMDTSELNEFMISNRKDARVYVGPYFAYLRKGFHQIDRRRTKTLDLVSVKNTTSVKNEMNVYWEKPENRPARGQFDLFMSALEHAAKSAGFEAVFVESIVSEWLPDKLSTYGYKRVSEYDVNYAKFV